jgi:hypothetical protein
MQLLGSNPPQDENCLWCVSRKAISTSAKGELSTVPAGDGNRVWFPDMIEMLRSQWNETVTFRRLIELSASLDEMFQQHQPAGPRLPSGSRCPECGRIVKSENFGRHRISVRATILTLGRFGIAAPALTKKIEKEWERYRAQKSQNGFDRYGRLSPAFPETLADKSNQAGCTHLVTE